VQVSANETATKIEERKRIHIIFIEENKSQKERNQEFTKNEQKTQKIKIKS